jgi:hypothetical protein
MTPAPQQFQPQPPLPIAVPDTPDYSTDALNIAVVYPTLAAAIAALGLSAVRAFDPSKPIKPFFGAGQAWFLVNGLMFQMTLTDPLINLPGNITFPPLEVPPTLATMTFAGVQSQELPTNEICNLADAQAVANSILASGVYPSGTTLVPVDAAAKGPFQIFGEPWVVVYGLETRRFWLLALTVPGKAPVSLGWAQSWLMAQAAFGNGAPGKWAIAPEPGAPPTNALGQPIPAILQWVQLPQVTVAPLNAQMQLVPTPKRALIEGVETLGPAQVGSPLFGIETTVVFNSNNAATPRQIALAQVQQLVAQYNAQPGVAPIAIS